MLVPRFRAYHMAEAHLPHCSKLREVRKISGVEPLPYDVYVTETTDEIKSAYVGRRIVAAALMAVIIGGTVALLFGPVVSMALTGDSYQWIQHAHLAAHRPALLLADLDTFFRPSTTWTLVVDRVLWGGFNTRGYRMSSLALHSVAALALAIVGWRLGLGWFAASAVGLVWATSPFTDESAFVVAYRFQPLLLISWLTMIAVWPRSGESWRGSRLAAAAVAVLAAAASKETWVVTPVLVAALEFERRRTWRAVMIPTLACGSAVAAYVIGYFVAFPTSKAYFEIGPHIPAKIPAQLAAFLYLEEPVTDGISLTWMGLFATVVMAAVVVCCLKWRVPGCLVAGCLFVLPILPTLLVPYMPQRYLAIPYAGFLLVVALWINSASEKKEKWRPLIRVGVIVIVALVVVAGAATVRADLEDYRRIATAHAVLLEETEQVSASVNGGGPVAVVRDEQTTPLLDVVKSPQGLPKLVFIRNHSPYGLIDTAALFEWVLADEGTRVDHVANWSVACAGGPGVVLVHRDGGFVDLGTTPDVANEIARWGSSGRGVQVVRAVPLD